MNMGATSRQKIIAIIVLFTISVAMVYQALARPFELANSADVEAYNKAVEMVGNPKIFVEEKIDSFANAKIFSEHQSLIESYSNYNLAYLLLIESGEDIEKLRTARGLLVEALRVNPSDYDIRINLELVTRLLIKEVKDKLVESGMSGEKAEEAASKQELGKLPSTGKDFSRRGARGSDY